MKTNAIEEKPFELLRRRNGAKFEDEIVRNWYIARQYVNDILINGAESYRESVGSFEPFKPNSNEYLHVVLADDSDCMLAIARQVSLSCHFLNFREEGDDGKPTHRTKLTIVSKDPNIKERLCSEEWLCNLPCYCRYSEEGKAIENDDSYIDIEVNVVSQLPESQNTEIRLVFTPDIVNKYFENISDKCESDFTINTQMAAYTQRMYYIGESIDNLEDVNIHDAKRYDLALDVCQHVKLADPLKPIFDIDPADQCTVKEVLSNIFCSDCFMAKSKVVKELSVNERCDEHEVWIKYNEIISRTEHSRWVVEKLIMGYRPLNEEEQRRETMLQVAPSGKQKLSNYWRGLKKNSLDLAHVDLRSYRNLRRIHPENMKYDSFLNLAIPKILKKIGIKD